MCEGGGGWHEDDVKAVVKIQLLISSSVADSTSQDFDDKATITAFWRRNAHGKSDTI